MIFGTYISWFINEIIAFILLMLCVVHISKSKDPIHRLLELICYIVTAGIFENIGVFGNVYYYSLDRVMMFGNVPFALLFIEGAIVYCVMALVERIGSPAWAVPFGAGVLASIQDMTLDPASVYDLHEVNGVMEGQWNWTMHYDGGFVGIPFFNFSGWLTMVLFFLGCCMLGRYLYARYKREWIGYAYPFVSIFATVLLLVSPINQFLLYLTPIFPMNSMGPEIVILVVNYAVCLFILLRFARYDQAFDAARGDRLLFGMPVFLHAYALISAIALGISQVILPIIVVAALHCGYLVFVYRKMKHPELAELR